VSAVTLAISAALAGCGNNQNPPAALPATPASASSASSVSSVSSLAAVSHTLFVEPDDGRGPILSAIQNARSSIWIVMYEFTDPQLVSAVASTAQRGVEVHVILNA